jgi:membrane protein
MRMPVAGVRSTWSMITWRLTPGLWRSVSTIALHTGAMVGSFVVITLLFAVIYKVLPEVHLSWGDVALSAFLTASLFMVGRVVIGKYLGHSTAVSVFGTASSLAVLLLWVYYSTLIFFLGAEITKIWKEPHVIRRKGRELAGDTPVAGYPPRLASG